MCLSLPVQIIQLDGNQAIGKFGNTEIEISLDLVENVQVNDYVLVHTGFALEKISDADAQKQLEYLRALNNDEFLTDTSRS